VVPHCVKLAVPITSEQLAWLVDAHPPLHEQLLE
jgi:hypothetical protein